MSSKRLYIGLLVGAMVAVIGYVSYGMVNIGKKETYYSVAVILDDSSNDRWNAFREGLEQGAEEHHIYLNLVSTSVFQSLEEECSVIQRELENGADGVIVHVPVEGNLGLFSEAVGSKPVVLVENGMQSEWYTVVAPDQRQLGAAVAESVLEGEQENLEGLTLGILSGNQRMSSQKQCLEGFLETMEGSGVEIVWNLSDEDWGSAAYLRWCQQEKPADVVVTLDNSTTEYAIAFLQENSDIFWRLYGEGRSEEAVYYLDKGYIEALVVPNEFYMGYRSVEIIAEKLNLETVDTEKNTVEFLKVTRKNLHDKDVEKILFPVVS